MNKQSYGIFAERANGGFSKIFLNFFKKHLHMSIFRLIFALEILSFIKVSSFRLVKEIGVGAMPFFDFLVLWPYVFQAIVSLYNSRLPLPVSVIYNIYVLLFEPYRPVRIAEACGTDSRLAGRLCRTACGVLLPAVKNKCGLFLFCAFLLVYSHYELKHTEKSHVYRRYCVDGA